MPAAFPHWSHPGCQEYPRVNKSPIQNFFIFNTAWAKWSCFLFFLFLSIMLDYFNWIKCEKSLKFCYKFKLYMGTFIWLSQAIHLLINESITYRRSIEKHEAKQQGQETPRGSTSKKGRKYYSKHKVCTRISHLASFYQQVIAGLLSHLQLVFWS